MGSAPTSVPSLSRRSEQELRRIRAPAAALAVVAPPMQLDPASPSRNSMTNRTGTSPSLLDTVLIDLHSHTRPISWDSFLTPDELVERGRDAGLDGIVFCEHDFCWDPEEVRALARRHSFLVLAGVEINTEDGHILVYGVDH